MQVRPVKTVQLRYSRQKEMLFIKTFTPHMLNSLYSD